MIAIASSFSEWFVYVAYIVWDKLIGYCYDCLRISPFEFGSTSNAGTGKEVVGIIAEVLKRSETTIIGVGTGLLLLVWVVGILREGGNLIADRAHPYAVVSHFVRLFICEGLIAGYMFIVKMIFDIFTLATKSVIGSNNNYGLIDPSNILLTDFFGNTIQNTETRAVIDLFTGVGGVVSLVNGQTSITDILLIDILSVIYLVVVIACALVIFMKVYGRYFRVIVAIVLTPIGVSFFGSSHTEQSGRKFLFYLMKQGAEGLVIAIDLLLFGIVSNAGTSIVPELITTIANGLTGSSDISLILSFLISQIFYCVLLMTIISASEKMVEQLM